MNTKAKRRFQTPHTFVILVALIVIAAIATYFVPAGEFVRYDDPVTGRTLVESGSYHTLDPRPFSFLKIPGAVYRALVDASDIVTFLLIIGGAFELVNETGAIHAMCKRLSKSFKGRELLVIPLFLTLFSIFGTTMGMSTEVAIFVPIGITLAHSLGLDKVTGTTMIALGAATGFTAGLLNPFSVGVAQDIAQVPLFSGIGYRAFILVVLLITDTIYISWYAIRVKKHPEKSIIYGEPEDDEFIVDNTGDDTMTRRQAAVLVILFASFALLIYGLMCWGWYFEEMAAVFLTMGVACGFVNGFGPNKVASVFGQGAKGIVVGALIVGIARGIEVVLSDAMVIDTVINAAANLVSGIPQSIQCVGMFLAQTIVSFLVTSGSGQAAITMPLMTPVADLVGISRQTAVLAFQLGDGFSNSILPTSSSLMGYLVVSKIPYSKWLKFMIPLFLIWTGLGCLFMLGAIAIGY